MCGLSGALFCPKIGFFFPWIPDLQRSTFMRGSSVRLVFNKVTYWENRNDLELPTSAYLGPVAQGGQGPPPMLAERFQSVITQLFQQV
jgi:hypothetical protein